MARDTDARFIPAGSCSWCGHAKHKSACSARIRTAPKVTEPCPCVRHKRDRR